MISYFTSVITWFKNISSSLLSWFFDTSNTNKVLIFIVPLFVIAGILVLFDFIIPMFFDLPRWRLNKQLNVMSPKNTYGLQINKHLIPRSPYSLRSFFTYRINNSLKTSTPRSLRAWASKEIKAFTVNDIKSFKVNDIKSFKVNDIKSFKVNDIKSFSVRDISPLSPRQISNFNIKPLSVVRLGGLTPVEMRNFGVKDLSGMYLSSQIVGSHLIDSHSLQGLEARKNHISSVNNLRVASVNYRINTNHDLTKLGFRAVENAKKTFHAMHDEAERYGTANDD